jgi:hypothetical protein
MFSRSPLQKTFAYDQPSCQLRVEGLPDLSAGQSSEDLGILTRWTLRWPGRPELEGERAHLEALIAATLPYARHLVSGVVRSFGTEPVLLSPGQGGRHRLQLISSQPGGGSLDVDLDDAELADLVRALDRLRLDPRVRLAWPMPPELPLRARELIRRVPLRRRLAAPLGGIAALALAASLAVLLPPPPPGRSPAPAAAPPSPARPDQ